MGGLADLLAGAGQIYGGYSEAEAQAQRARQAKIAEEMAALELAGRKRLADYDAKVSGGLADFLPGGGRATTVQTPGEGAVIPATPVDDEGNAMPMDMGKAKPVQTENRLGALEFMHRAALEAGLPDKADGIQKRMGAFRNEGLEDTAKAIMAGASDDEIRDAFNRTGKVRLARVQRIPGSDSAIIGITEDGRATQFDARNLLRSAMGPKEITAADDKDADRAIRAREQGRKDEETSARSRYWDALGEAAKTRATRGPAAKTPKAPDPAKERAERRRFTADVARYAKEEAYTEDEDGKTVLNRDLANQIAGLAALLADDDPELLGDPRAAAQAARARLEDLRRKAGDKATREWGGMAERAGVGEAEFEGVTQAGGGKEGRQAFVERRTREILNRLMRGAANRKPAGQKPPKVGEVVDGMTFLGGDPRDRNSWR